LDPKQIPNGDIDLSEAFVEQHQELIMFAGVSLLEAAQQTPGTVDADVCEMLESLIRTYRTLQSGLYYESRPANLLAAAVQQHLQQKFEEYRQRQRDRAGVSGVRDAEILGALVFWQRTALGRRNGRRLGRSFLGFLRGSLAEAGILVGPGGVQARSYSPLAVP
jgi:hypothetical protein